MIRVKSDKIITPEGLFDGYLYADGGKITEITVKEAPCRDTYDFTGLYVSPGFIDLHSHGGGGYAFMDSNADAVLAGCDFHLAHGTTTILPTISAGPFTVMRRAVEAIDSAMRSGRAKGHIFGAHLEGPYLSAKQCGAQCPDFITLPKREEYESLFSEFPHGIARWTYAPENDPKGEFCRFVTEHGAVASAGHTDGTYADMKTAIENGCDLVTHLYSCTSTVTRDHGFRRLGVIESAFLRDELFVEIIADGKHLPPELVEMILKVKGKERVALITDSLAIAGTDIKEGVMSGTEFIVEDGVCKLKDRSAFAGSVATADLLVRVLVKECGVSVCDAVKMMAEVPARILKVKRGRLARGYAADLVIFDKKITVRNVFADGSKVI